MMVMQPSQTGVRVPESAILVGPREPAAGGALGGPRDAGGLLATGGWYAAGPGLVACLTGAPVVMTKINIYL